MQKRTGFIGIATTLLMVGWSQAGMAQGNCGDIVFDQELSSRFPNARNACLDVSTRDGTQFAHFKARVTRVRGNTVEAEFTAPDGSVSRPISFTPAADARVRIGTTNYRYRDLSRGQELDIYVPANRWEIAVHNPDTSFAAAPTVAMVALTDAPAATLPRTGSPLPLFALLGTLLTALGVGVGSLRRKLGRAA